MAQISKESVDAVREAADLVELVGARVSLTRRSGRWWGRCPFHDERTPSFSLLPPDFRRYYCHGCHATGDAFDWMRDQEGVQNFAEAVEMLAERFGITVALSGDDPHDRAVREAKEQRVKLLERATEFYERSLWESNEGKAPRDYLLGRGFEESLLRRFRVGFAPGGGNALARRALNEGYTRELLVDAGLARLRGGQAGDFFVSRIMFPIADAQGRVQGFGGRTLDPAERAKYVNSPEGEQFRKRSLLFGLAQARSVAAKRQFFVVAEGYTDVFALVSAGIESAVACMGTSLTSEQLRLLRRYAREVRLSFDGDRAGEQAAWRTAEAAQGITLSLSAVRLPSGLDPGDLAGDEEGRRALNLAVDSSEPLVTSLIRSRVARAGRSPRDRGQALEEIAQLLRRFPDDSMEKDEGVRLAAGLLQLSQGVQERLRTSSRQSAPAGAVLPQREAPAQEVRERRFLAMAVALPKAAGDYLQSLSPDAFEVPEHRTAHELLRSGAVDLDAWPEELGGLVLGLRLELAGTQVTEEELREAALRLELPMLERRAAQMRAAGDDAGWLEAQELARRVRAALRGDG